MRTPDQWTARERRLLRELRDPARIQTFLDALPYLPEGGALSPRTTLETGTAQCFGGAILAAAALSELGHRPLLLNLRAENDDDHVLAVFRHRGLWGAVAKSNCTTLRHREPVYRSLRELVMSYFDFYFRVDGVKTLRSYSVTLDLSRYDASGWRFAGGRLLAIEEDIERLRHYDLVPRHLRGHLALATPDVLAACLLGSRPEGLFRPS